MITYLLQVTICWGLFLGLYHLALRKETFFMVNRTYLLLTIILGLVIPRMTWDTSMFMEQPNVEVAVDYLSYGFYHLNEVLAPVATTTEVEIAAPNPISALALLYWAGVLFMIIKLATGIVRIRLMYRSAHITYKDGQRIAHTSRDHAPFAFFDTIYLSASRDDLNNDNAILIHEQAHVSGWHTFDVLFVEIIKAFFWFNPLVYGYDHAIKTVHEYIADANVLQRTALQRYGRLLLRQAQPGLEIALANHFYNHQLKKRFKMMTRTPSQKRMLLKYLSVLPFILVVSLVFTNQKVQAEISKVEEMDLEGVFTSNIEDKVDALLDRMYAEEHQSFWAHFIQIENEFQSLISNKSNQEASNIVQYINNYSIKHKKTVTATLSPEGLIGIGYKHLNGAKSFVYPQTYESFKYTDLSNNLVYLNLGEMTVIIKKESLPGQIYTPVSQPVTSYTGVSKNTNASEVSTLPSSYNKPKWPRPRHGDIVLSGLELSNIRELSILKGGTVLTANVDYKIDLLSGTLILLKDTNDNDIFYVIENDLISDFINSDRIAKDIKSHKSQKYYLKKIFKNKSFRDKFKTDQLSSYSNQVDNRLDGLAWEENPIPLCNEPDLEKNLQCVINNWDNYRNPEEIFTQTYLKELQSLRDKKLNKSVNRWSILMKSWKTITQYSRNRIQDAHTFKEWGRQNGIAISLQDSTVTGIQIVWVEPKIATPEEVDTFIADQETLPDWTKFMHAANPDQAPYFELDGTEIFPPLSNSINLKLGFKSITLMPEAVALEKWGDKGKYGAVLFKSYAKDRRNKNHSPDSEKKILNNKDNTDSHIIINNDEDAPKSQNLKINSLPKMFNPKEGPLTLDKEGRYGLEVYSYWGNSVFRSNNYKNNWDGTYNGIPLATGDYFYHVKNKTGRWDYQWLTITQKDKYSSFKESPVLKPVELKIYNIGGQTVYHEKQFTKSKYQIDKISNLKNGTYSFKSISKTIITGWLSIENNIIKWQPKGNGWGDEPANSNWPINMIHDSNGELLFRQVFTSLESVDISRMYAFANSKKVSPYHEEEILSVFNINDQIASVDILPINEVQEQYGADYNSSVHALKLKSNIYQIPEFLGAKNLVALLPDGYVNCAMTTWRDHRMNIWNGVKKDANLYICTLGGKTIYEESISPIASVVENKSTSFGSHTIKTKDWPHEILVAYVVQGNQYTRMALVNEITKR